jgi:hypothetical protein
MPNITFSPAGQYGVISDLAPHELPLNAWSRADNVHFLEGYAEKVLGYKSVFGGTSVPPYFLTSVRPETGNAFWVYAGDTAVYCYDSGHHNITRSAGAYTSAGKLLWHGGVMNGLLYLNNAVDTPQVWSPAVNTQLLVDLPNWPANTTAAVVRSFKNFMVALDVTVSGSRNARLVKWSHPAAAGTYPSSWDHTDPTKDAGEYPLAETEGLNIDCLPLRDTNIIYKDDSVWGMSYIGGNDIFRFFNIFRNIGIISRNCAVEFQTGQHLVFARDDVFAHDGQTPVSVVRGRTRKELYNSLDFANLGISKVVLDAANSEVWVCYPETGATFCNRALVWNWRTGTTSFKDLPDITGISLGIADEYAGSDNWDSATGSWDSDGAQWGQTVANPAQTRLVMAQPSGSKLFAFTPDATSADGTAFEALLERTGLGIPFKEKLPPDISSVKFCSAIWPQITGTLGGIVQVRLGTQMDFSDAPVWGSWQDFVIGTTKKLDVLASGRLFAISFRSTTAIEWKLQGYSLVVEKLGDY